MLKTILFDDEPGALKMLEIQLGKIEGVSIEGVFTTYSALIEWVLKSECQIAFVDIEVPGKSGIEIAKELKALRPELEIVFVTAHRQYAADAFELEAFDYILKPVKKERLQRLIDKYARNGENRNRSGRTRIYMMKRFAIKNAEGKIVSWRTKKTEELIAYLVHNKGVIVSSEVIVDVLWPETPYFNGKKLLYTTSYYLKKTLEIYGIDLFEKASGYRVSMDDIWCDCDELEKALVGPRSGGHDMENVKHIIDLYSGGYLEDNYYGWAENKKDDIEKVFAHAIMEIVCSLRKEKRLPEAVYVLNRIIDSCPFYEYAYQAAISIYGEMNEAEGREKMLCRYHAVRKGMGLPSC